MTDPQRAAWRPPFYLCLSLLLSSPAWSSTGKTGTEEFDLSDDATGEISLHQPSISTIDSQHIYESMQGPSDISETFTSLLALYESSPELKQILYQFAQAHPQEGKSGIYFYRSDMIGDHNFHVHDGVIYVVDTTDVLLRTFILPDLSDPEQCQRWYPHLLALEIASLEGHLCATQTLLWIRQLGLEADLQAAQHRLGIAAFSKQGDLPEAFKNWVASREMFVFHGAKHENPEVDFQRKVDFLKQHTSASWWAITMSSSIISDEKVLVSFDTFKGIVGDAQKLADGVMELTKGLFPLFSAKGLETWDSSFIAQSPYSTIAERHAVTRQMMLMIHEMPQQAFWTFSKLANFVKPHDITAGSIEELERFEMLFTLFDTIADVCHWNSDLLAAQTDRKESAGAYGEFMSSLWNNLIIYGWSQLSHPLLTTDRVVGNFRELLPLEPVDLFRRLARKTEFSKETLLPYLGFAQQWFEILAQQQSDQVDYLKQETENIKAVVSKFNVYVRHLDADIALLNKKINDLSQQSSEMLLIAGETKTVKPTLQRAILKAMDHEEVFKARVVDCTKAKDEVLNRQAQKNAKLSSLEEAIRKHSTQAMGYHELAQDYLGRQTVIAPRVETFFSQARERFESVFEDLTEEERDAWIDFLAEEDKKADQEIV